MTEPLWVDDKTGRAAPGAVERATRDAIAAAALEAKHAGACEALATLAWALDAARAAGKFYGVAQAAPPYTDLARSLGMTLDAGKEGGPGDQLDAWLAGLTSPTLGDPAQP